MTIEEIDKKGFKVKLLKRKRFAGRENYDVVLLERNKKMFIAWKPVGHTEYTKPFQISKKD